MTLLSAFDARLGQSTVRNLGACILASLLLTISAKISVPFYPVPQTMQTLVVMGIGLALGPYLGVAAVAIYLAEGALGLPVFAGTPQKGIGLAYMAGPTGGYLLGYVLAVFVTGHLAQRAWKNVFFASFLSVGVGAVVLYIPGLVWLGILLGWDKPILEWGLYPFVLGDVLKAALAAWIFTGAHKAIKSWRVG